MLLQATFLIWLNRFLVRRIGAEEYSLLPMFSAIAVCLPLMSTVFTSGVSRYVLEAYARRDSRGITCIISSIYPLILGVVFLTLAVGGALVTQVDSVFVIAPDQVLQAQAMLAIMILAFVSRLLLEPFQAGIYVHQRFVLKNVIELLGQFLGIGLLAALLLKVSTRLVWVTLSSALGNTLVQLSLAIVSLRLLPCLRFRPRAFRSDIARRLVSFGGWLSLMRFSDALLRSAVPLLLNRFSASTELVSLHLGRIASRQISSFMMDVTSPCQPAMTAMYVQGHHEQVRIMFFRLGRLSLWALGVVVAPLVVFRGELFVVYLGEKFTTYSIATAVMMIDLLAIYLYFSVYAVGRVAVAQARVRGLAIVYVIWQVIALALTFYFVVSQKMGAIGAAYAALIASVLVCFLGFLPLSLKLVSSDLRMFLTKTLIPGCVPGFFGGAAMLFLRHVASQSTWLRLGTCTAIGMGVTLVSTFFCFQQEDRADAKRIWLYAVGRLNWVTGPE